MVRRCSAAAFLYRSRVRRESSIVSRRVFFSLDFAGDAGRANQIRRCGAIDERDMEGFFTAAELEKAAQQGDAGVQQLIQGRLRNTSVTVVLIGAETANHPWVKYEIDQSIGQMNGLLGIYVGHLQDDRGRTPSQGLKPIVPAGIEFPAYSWDGDADRLVREIVAAGKRSDVLRARGSATRRQIVSPHHPRLAFLTRGSRPIG